MHLRPAPAYWFETYVPRNETVYALEALASTGLVELELDTRLAQSMDLESVPALINRFHLISDQCRSLLPKPDRAPKGLAEAPEDTARKAVNCLENWQQSIDGLLQRQRQLDREIQNLKLVRECILAIHAGSYDVDHLLQDSLLLFKGVFACPRTEALPSDICASLDEFIPGPEHNFFIIVDESACRDLIVNAYHGKTCYSLQVPDWLPSEHSLQLEHIDVRLADLEVLLRKTQLALEKKRSDPSVSAALADMGLIDWYLSHSAQVASVGKLCHVTGWTTTESTEVLQQAFRNAGIHGVIRFASPPDFSKVPVNMAQPWWSRPFLLIVQMLGTPDSTEIDSSKLLPFIVPLLFGYMFPDLGHGLMLVVFSVVMYRRWPDGRLLIPCGLSAMFFGLVFGEVFGLEHVIDPLWVRPLEHPLDVLLAPMLLGVGLIQLGLIFNGAESVWRGEIRIWLLREAAIMVLYPALLIGLFVHELLWVAALSAAWFLVGHWIINDSGLLARLGKSLGLLLQSAFELLQNTLSFLRVGAFALAHAALSLAVLGMTDAITNEVIHAVLLAIGHLFIVTLEGLVVFVQTTRLVLLEFFIRFLRAEGRMFSPLTEPPQQNR